MDGHGGSYGDGVTSTGNASVQGTRNMRVIVYVIKKIKTFL